MDKLITEYESPKISIDSHHTPSIYARFLRRLLNRADELNGEVPAKSGEDEGAGGLGEPKLEFDNLWEFPEVQRMA